MKGAVRIAGFALFLLCTAVHGNAGSANILVAKNYDLVLDAVLIAGGIAFEEVQLNNNDPMFSSTQESYIEESIPTWAAAAITGPFCGLPLLVEGRGGMYHARGFALSYSANAFAQSFVGSITGRHRPNYNAAQMVGEDAEKSSFYSGHAAISFGTAAYASAYLMRYSPRAAIPVAVALYTGAGYMAYTRYAEHYHHISDLIVGAVVGSGISLGLFRYFEKHRSTASRPEVLVGFHPAGVNLQLFWRFL